MRTNDELAISKSKLCDALGDNFKSYLRLLRIWFKCNLTKEEFDHEAKKFLTPETISYHNQFLIALLNKCQQPSPLTTTTTATHEKANSINIKIDTENDNQVKKMIDRKKIKRNKSSNNQNNEQRFEPIDIREYIKNETPKLNLKEEAMKITFCANDGTLPDHFMANLRILVGAWELGLDNVTDEAVSLLNQAIRHLMKNIITAMLTLKSSYRTYNSNNFIYAVGTSPINHYLNNSKNLIKYSQNMFLTQTDENGQQYAQIPPTVDLSENEAVSQVACSTFRNDRKRKSSNENKEKCNLNLWHLYHALKTQKSILTSHSVYSVNMERVLTKLE